MGGESPSSAVPTPSGAVFLSYASQDAEAAQRICEALRGADIEVWFDQSELRGGDAWDQSIRKQIRTCSLFVPIVSKNTHARAEGYFRLEWKLAVDRSHLIMANKPFIVPVVIDDTPDDDENVPEKFREMQWTQLPGGETPAAFVARVAALLGAPAPLPTSNRPVRHWSLHHQHRRATGLSFGSCLRSRHWQLSPRAGGSRCPIPRCTDLRKRALRGSRTQRSRRSRSRYCHSST
jgi:hypothetical protein